MAFVMNGESLRDNHDAQTKDFQIIFSAARCLIILEGYQIRTRGGERETESRERGTLRRERDTLRRFP